MPRPKKPGAPEPKKRSRNGCWPCKTRKVKCDEARPTCVNCQRQGETCDYSIRLNWEGRGKNKVGTGTAIGHGDFSANLASLNSASLNTMEIATAMTPSMMNFQVTGNFSRQSQSELDHASERSPAHSPIVPARPNINTSQNPLIDPAIMGHIEPSPFQEGLYLGGRQEQQYAQSYERYRALTPSTPITAPPEAVSNISHAHVLKGVIIPTTDYDTGARSDGTFSLPAVFATRVGPITTSPFGEDNDAGESSKSDGSFTRPVKRMRYQSSRQEVDSTFDTTMPPPNSAPFVSCNPDSHASNVFMAAPSSIGTPLTPASSYSDEVYKTQPSKLSPQAPLDASEHRRLSVGSLLSGPPGPALSTHSDHTYASFPSAIQDWSLLPNDVYQDTTTYGIDRGIKDLDIGKNDDMKAISGASPITLRDHLDLVMGEDGQFSPVEFGFGMEIEPVASETGAYYDKPVSISIPRILEPLPTKLLENPMNLLYFHHFLNHTAGCLIPHNCSSNPFRIILPQMAVQDDNLMNLLLAYSASHRARLLRQPEPATRIALWVQDIFPNLRRALDEPSEIISNANLATAIMLASLEIISPKAFGVEVPWQTHLDTARQMIAARGGPQRMRTASFGDKVSSFLWSWFAYLDVLGSLSGGKANASTSAWILDYESDAESSYQIDCILGFTSRCILILAKIAELSRICDHQRIGPDHTILADWKASEDIVIRADKLEADLAASRLHPAKPCTHMQSTGEAAYQWDSLEMAAVNEAFHWAGLVHLHRRILGKPSTHTDVQTAVRQISGALFKVRRGSSAEACLLFPMFTAGCDTDDEKQRTDILDRIKDVERFGMTQVRKARTLMERVWETGKPWETLVAGEFFG